MTSASTEALRAHSGGDVHAHGRAGMSFDLRRSSNSKYLNDGNHLEMGMPMTTASRRPSAPTIPSVEPRSSTRVSFSLLRPTTTALAKESGGGGGGMRRSSLASIFARSRDNLQITTSDVGAAEEDLKTPPRRLSEATMIAKSFMIKTFGSVGPKRQSFSTSNQPSSKRPSTTYSNEARGGNSPTSSGTHERALGSGDEGGEANEEAASRAFASAFGAPQADALDEEPSRDPPPYSCDHSLRSPGNSRPTSMASAATSFFSVQGGPLQGSNSSFTASPARQPSQSLPQTLPIPAGEPTTSSSPLSKSKSVSMEPPHGLFASTSSFQRAPQDVSQSSARFHSRTPEVGPLDEERDLTVNDPYYTSSSLSRLGRESTADSGLAQPSRNLPSTSALGLEAMAGTEELAGARKDLDKGKMRQSDDSELSRRGSSRGIDEEQDALDRAQAAALYASGPTAIGTNPLVHEGQVASSQHPAMMTHASTNHGDAAGGANNDNNTNNNGASRNGARPGRSSRLSQLPRLNSMRVEAGSGQGGSGAAGGGAGGDGGDDNQGRRNGLGAATRPGSSGEIYSSEDETGDETASRGEAGAHTEDSGTTTDEDYDSFFSGSEDDENDSSMPGSMPSHDRRSSGGRDDITALSFPSSREASHTPATSAEGPMDSGISRVSKPEGIQLPPTPQFGQQRTAMPEYGFANHAIGKDSWTQFSSSTPFESPVPFATPRAGPMAGFITRTAATPRAGGQTPKSGIGSASTATNNATAARSESSGGESSYFNINPSAPRFVNGSTATTNGEMPPPPSPSIISRHRAPSSASTRSMRSIPVPTPNREYPHLPPVIPIKFGGKDRARSPNPPSTASRESTDVVPPLPSSPALQSPSSSNAKQVAGKKTSPPPVPMHAGSMRSSRSARPGLYQQQSRSLIDLSVNARDVETRLREPEPLRSTPALKAPSNVKIAQHRELAHDASTPAFSPPVPQSPGALRRRRSMFEVGATPPPYSVIHRRPEGAQMIYPREEEGRERLPQYNCSVHIEGFLPRKMEFSAPGVQAKDRSWRRLYFVLHGTSLRVYKADLSGDALIAKGAWGPMDGVHVHKEPMNEDGSLPATASATPSATANGSSVPSSAQHGLSAAVGAVSNLTSTFGHNPLTNNSSSLTSANVPPKAGLVRNYTLQGAESGLAADYLKRRHVVRVRAEGEQFLLQTKSDRHVVDWIEAFQASTNVSMDLERRPMPKFITLPRRRRRRRPQDGAAGGGAAGQNGSNRTAAQREAAELAEAERRSRTDVGGSGAASQSGANRVSPPRPLGLPGEELSSSQDPSAAFDEMLREEHEEMSRQDAGDI